MVAPRALPKCPATQLRPDTEGWPLACRGEASGVFMDFPMESRCPTLVVNAAFLCYTSKLPGAFLLHSLGVCLSSRELREFSACFRGKGGLPGEAACKRNTLPKRKHGPGLQPDSAAAAGSLCVPLRTFCKSQCKQAACSFSHEIWK